MRELDPKIAKAVDLASGAGWADTEHLRQAGRRAVEAYLDATAPSRAPDGGDLVERLRSAARSWRRDDAEKARDPEAEASLWDEAADELARLAASHAGDRERLLEEALKPFADRCAEAVRPDDSDNDGVTVKTVHLRRAFALAPAAGQDEAGEVERA